MTSDLEVLARLVRRHVDGVALPTHIRQGEFTVPLANWLGQLAFDHREAPMGLGTLIEHQIERPSVAEIAQTLAARIAAQN